MNGDDFAQTNILGIKVTKGTKGAKGITLANQY
ncbi:hypothetical protein Pse7367_3815 (plasmid) [Thalassoporum mexicanum PCC 7367]|nr:hypothetical protein Pse7367_3815 [Pseudanabaena sp. PCC 7367]